MNIRIIVLGFLGLVAIVAVVLLVMHFTKATPVAQPVAVAVAKPMVRVVVAKVDLPVGHRISRDDLSWQEWPADAVGPAFITDGAAPPTPTPPKGAPVVVPAGGAKSPTEPLPIVATISGSDAINKLDSAIVREPIMAKEPVVERKIVRAGEGGVVAAVLAPGMRAVSIPINAESAAGGLIQPGDRVDLVQSHHLDKSAGGPSGGPEIESHVVMRNLKVLAIDQNIESKGDKPMIGATATLEVAAADTSLVARAKSQGDFILALRSYADAGGPSGRVNDADSHQIKFYRAGQRSEVTVNQ